MAGSLYSAHATALKVLHGDLDRYASSHEEMFVGTAGSVVERTNASGFRFYAHQFYDGDGKKRERYLAGPIHSPDADAAAATMRTRIAELKELVPSLRLLAREGYNAVDAKTYATLTSLHNHGVFAAGGMLIGSHAYGVLLNQLGVRGAAYATEDIDIARREALAFKRRPTRGFLEMLRESGIEFVEVPASGHKYHLGYLLGVSQMAMLLAREGCCTVRVPVPERFAIHKLIVSRLRKGREAKSDKDVLQSAVLCAVLAERHPGALESALAKTPKRARAHLARALRLVHPLLEAHPRAQDELSAGR
jgi:hypothetical protein